MRVLVTGGLGLLGRAVTRDLRAAGHDVTVLARRPGAGVMTADLRDRERIREVVAGFDAVCHLAALTRARDSFADPLSFYDVNVAGTLNLLLGAAPGTRFVFASTNLVYGSSHTGALHEDLEPRPESPYAASKLAAEQLIAAQAATGAIGAVSLRLFNVAGAVDGVGDTDTARIIPNVFRALTGELPHITLNGDGSVVRDYVHMVDAAAAVREALSACPPGRHRVYNVGSGVGTSVAQIVAAAEAVAGRPVPVERMPPKPEPQSMTGDIGRAVRELGWRPTRSTVDEIVADAWAAWQR